MYFKNLFNAVLALLIDLLLGIDRIGNALCSGDYKATVSGRVGFFAKTKKNRYWSFLRMVIDRTFRPLEGKNHCYRAYLWEKGRGLDHRRGSDLALALLSVIVVLSCIFLSIVIWFIALFKKH